MKSKAEQRTAFHAPLKSKDSELQTEGCRHTNPDICASNALPKVCAFARSEGLCVKRAAAVMNAHPQSVSQKLRMAGRDYTRRGWVFVTLSADDHRHLFGGIGDAPVMVPNALGRLVADDWARIPAYFSGVRLGAFQIMPNHFHGLLWLSGFQTAAHPGGNTPGPEKIVSLGEIINPFKGGVTRKWRRVVASRFEGSRFSESSPLCVWQPNYWDVICFNDEELAQKEAYIRANPLRWTLKRLPRGRVPEGRYLGNLALLRAAPKRALRISRRATAEDIEKAFAEASDNGASGNAVVVGTVFSPGERAVLDRLLARSDARLIWLAPMCLPETVPSKWGAALAEGLALWLSPFAADQPDATRATCEQCNARAQRLEEQGTQ